MGVLMKATTPQDIKRDITQHMARDMTWGMARFAAMLLLYPSAIAVLLWELGITPSFTLSWLSAIAVSLPIHLGNIVVTQTYFSHWNPALRHLSASLLGLFLGLLMVSKLNTGAWWFLFQQRESIVLSLFLAIVGWVLFSAIHHWRQARTDLHTAQLREAELDKQLAIA